MAHCCVPMCKNDARYDKNKRFSFHSFPKEERLRNEWKIKVRREEGPNFRIGKHTKVCSAHFKATDFKRTLTGRRDLKKEAIPSIFAWTSKVKTKDKTHNWKMLQKIDKNADCITALEIDPSKCTSDHEYVKKGGCPDEKFQAALSLIDFSKLEVLPMDSKVS